MANQDDRLGSLLTFNDIALILSTYGVLLLFNYLFEPLNSNTWIVCTFFVGIKILIVGIADITGVGKSYIVSILFVLISDGIIILINQLMAFGLSLRLMLIMVVADIIFVILAIFIWKRLGRDNVKINYDKDDWIYSDESETPKAEENIVKQKEEQSSKEAEAPVIQEEKALEIPEVTEEENIFDFQSLKNQSPDIENTQSKIFENFDNESVIEGEEILNFEELTQELPTQEELNKALEVAEEENTVESSVNYFEGLDFFNDFSYQEEKGEPSFTTNSEPVETESTIEKPEEVVQEEITPESETIQEEVLPEEPTQEETVSTEVTEELEEETPEEETISVINIPEEEPIIEEEEKTEETVEPETIQEDQTEEIQEKIEPEEEPLFISNLNDFTRITGSPVGITRRFNIIPVNVNQDQIDQYKTEVNDELIRFNNNLHKLVDEYNNSLSLNDESRIVDFVDISEVDSIDHNDRALRNNINSIDEQEFISDGVMHSLKDLINKLDNRIYNINFAEENLKERLLREQQREEERKRREEEARLKKEAQERQERAERERIEKEKQERERLEAQKKTEKPGVNPAISSNEVRLQSDDMDIIIDAADLELLKEFLAQQETNN